MCSFICTPATSGLAEPSSAVECPCPLTQVAIKTAQLGVFYYTDAIALEALFLEGGRIEAGVFVSSWKSIPDANEATKQLPLGIGSVEELQVPAPCAPSCCSTTDRSRLRRMAFPTILVVPWHGLTI